MPRSRVGWGRNERGYRETVMMELSPTSPGVIVAQEPVGLGTERAGIQGSRNNDTVLTLVREMQSGDVQRIIHVVQDVEIQPAVVVEIDPHRAGAPQGIVYATLFGNVAEPAIAFVVVEVAAACAGDEQVEQPVIVIISPVSPHAEVMQFEPCMLCDIGERAVPVVMKQAIPNAVFVPGTEF